jgi:catechol 2,3-dioxygenase-like lactoylglutathione lyase family enzyme
VAVSRVQLALNVADIDEAVAFYSKLFGTEPAKIRPGYANFAIAEPPLKLVLIEDKTKQHGTINHLGVEVVDRAALRDAVTRLETSGLSVAIEDEVTCCYSLQDKVWVNGPGGEPWEIYTVLADAETPNGALGADDVADPACCVSLHAVAPTPTTAPWH